MSDFAEIKEEFLYCEQEYEIARTEYNDALEALQDACEHLTIVGGNENYGDVDWRVCVTCGLVDFKGYNDDGDEYNYATRKPFQTLRTYSAWGHRIDGVVRKDICGTRAYEPTDGKELQTFRKYKV